MRLINSDLRYDTQKRKMEYIRIGEGTLHLQYQVYNVYSERTPGSWIFVTDPLGGT